jgi:hypothetical protein
MITPVKVLASKIQSQFVGQKVLPRQDECVLDRMNEHIRRYQFCSQFYIDLVTRYTVIHNQR